MGDRKNTITHSPYTIPLTFYGADITLMEAPRKTDGVAIENYHIRTEPYYLPIGDEIDVFERAYKLKLPVMLKGPTGCGKTRFLEHMAWKLDTSAGDDCLS